MKIKDIANIAAGLLLAFVALDIIGACAWLASGQVPPADMWYVGYTTLYAITAFSV